MIHRIFNEMKIMGSSICLVAALLVAALVFLAMISGELLNVSCIGFEVIFPFFAAVAVGEWGRTRADGNFAVIAAQSSSLFTWVFTRFTATAAITSLFAMVGMVLTTLIRREMPLGELMLIYFPTAFLLSALSLLVGLCSSGDHTAALACGVVWLMALLVRSLLRIPGVACFYLFVRFGGVQSSIWVVNKVVLCILGLVLCGAARSICNKRLMISH